MVTRGLAFLSAAFLLGCPRLAAPPSSADRTRVVERIAAYRADMLDNARIPPPSVDPGPRSSSDGAVSGTAAPLRPEDAPWNQWIDGGPRLFNNRAALLFDVAFTGPGPLAWDASAARLEVNDERTVIAAAPSAEVLLGELLFNAYLEEQWGVDGDLLNRTRGAGPFRAAYLPDVGEADALTGVIAFPLSASNDPSSTDRSEIHVVAMRLTVPITAADGPHELVWVFD